MVGNTGLQTGSDNPEKDKDVFGKWISRPV